MKINKLKVSKKSFTLRTDLEKARASALASLCMREHSIKEITDKLTRKEYQQDSIEIVIKECLGDNYLNDQRFAEIYWRSRARKGFGPNKIAVELKQKGISFFKSNRGGDITFHGPEQIVGYPIIDLEDFKADIRWYMRSLEEVIILTIANYGLKGVRSDGETGVWLDVGTPFARKICALGVRTSRWVTMHGFALNVNTNLGYFDHIIPCGIRGKAVTSMEAELNKKIPMEEVKELILENFKKVFDVEWLSE